jgi:mono/diheme cytochrome c family protein
MTRRAWIFLSLFAVISPDALAQQLPNSSPSQQALGHRLFVQSCAVCHLKPSPTAERYGPALWKETVDGREADARDLIRTGSERMPGFQYDLQPAQIDAIIQYLATVPEPQPGPTPAPRH